MPLVLDIETVPLESSLTRPYPADRQPPANYKSDETIAKWREMDRQRWETDRAKEYSLNPRLGRVLCFGWAVTDDYGTVLKHGVEYAATEGQEFIALGHFWQQVAEQEARVVTWNGSWDLRFLVMRSVARNLQPSIGGATIREWFRKYVTQPHFDCKAVVLNWDVRISGEGLDEWSKFLGLPGKTEGISGKDVWPLYQGGMHDEIAEYCMQDVLATAAVYERLVPYFGTKLAPSLEIEFASDLED
jgi:predicted PolB exonuclease-like 3'-5' exonuclease